MKCRPAEVKQTSPAFDLPSLAPRPRTALSRQPSTICICEPPSAAYDVHHVRLKAFYVGLWDTVRNAGQTLLNLVIKPCPRASSPITADYAACHVRLKAFYVANKTFAKAPPRLDQNSCPSCPNVATRQNKSRPRNILSRRPFLSEGKNEKSVKTKNRPLGVIGVNC
jgi:hypothetical protein